MHGDSHQPGLFTAFSPEGINCPVGFHKGFLNSVFRQGPVTEVKAAHTQQRLLIPVHQTDQFLIAIRGSVRAHNNAHVSLTSYIYIDVLRSSFCRILSKKVFSQDSFLKIYKKEPFPDNLFAVFQEGNIYIFKF